MTAIQVFLNSLQPIEQLDVQVDLVDLLKTAGIKVIYEPSVITEKKGRIMFSTQRFNADFRDALVRECGGVVVDVSNWNILAMPPPPFNPRINISRVKLSNYYVSYINEGTTITLYYYNDKWCIASTNGYDVSDLIWSGNKTYRQVFDEILVEYPDFKWDALDKNASYTIGFHHSEFHPFKGPSEKDKHAWLIYHTSKKVVSINNASLIGIPTQRQVTGVFDIHELIKMAKNSMEEFIEKKTVLYGFILRNKNDQYGQFSNILIESALLKRIRELIYNDKTDRLNPHHENYIGSAKRMEYIALKSYLDINNRQIFIMMFPQYQVNYNKYEKCIAELAQRLITGESKTECLENDIRTVLLNTHKLMINKDTSVDIIIDLITSVRWLDAFYSNF